MKLHEEFKLFEDMWETTEQKTSKALNENLNENFKEILFSLKDRLADLAMGNFADFLIFVMNSSEAIEPQETDLSNEETIIFSSKSNGDYIIRKEDEARLKEIDEVTDKIWSYNDTFAGYEIFTYILALLKIPFEYYTE